MTIRDRIGTAVITFARRTAQSIGTELVVEQDDHSINLSMEVPNKSKRAWDRDLFHRGQLYRTGFANPVKIGVERGEGIQDEDKVNQSVGPDETTVMASQRYQDYMEMDMVEALLNPQEQWRYILYAAVAAAIAAGVSALLSGVVVFG